MQIAIDSFLLLPVGLSLIDQHWSASAALQVAFAWLMSFGLIGLFHRFLVRYTFIGRLLTGRRTRDEDAAQRAKLAAAG